MDSQLQTRSFPRVLAAVCISASTLVGFAGRRSAAQTTSITLPPVSVTATASASISAPFAWTLFHSGKSTFTFNTLIRSDTPVTASGTMPILSSLNWVGNTRFLNTSTLKSTIVLDLHGGNWLDRSAFGVADSTKLRYADVSVRLARAGTESAPGKDSGIAAGKEIAELLTTLHPMSSMSISTTMRETTMLEQGSGAASGTTREFGASLALNLPYNTKLQAGRSDVSTSAGGSGSVSTVTDTVKLDSDVAAKTHISAAYSAASTTNSTSPADQAAASGTYTQSSSIQVTSKAVDKVAIAGSISNSTSGSGSTDAAQVSVEAAPFAGDKKKKQLAALKVKASAQTTITANGVANSGSAQVEIPALPIAQTSVTGGVTHSADPTRSLTVGQLDATAKPNKFLQITGTARLRDSYSNSTAPDPYDLNTYGVKALFGPSKMLKLTGSYASNPEAGGTVSHATAQSLGLESDFNLLKFTGQVGSQEDYTASRLTNNMLLGIDLRITPHDILSTTWEGRSTLDSVLQETSTYRLAYTHKLGSVVDISFAGSMTQSATNGVAVANANALKAEAKIGLHF